MSKPEAGVNPIEELARISDLITVGETELSVDDPELVGLVDTIAKVHKIASAAVPTAGFAARLWERMQAELSQADIRSTSSGHFKDVVRRLLSEQRFRESFYASPVSAFQNTDLHLSPVEIAVLEEMEPESLAEWFSEFGEGVS